MRIFWFAPALVLAGSVVAPGLASAQPGALPCAQLSMAQTSDCPWSGTITLTRSDSGSTSTPIPASINDRGGTQTQTYSIHDVTTIQVQGDQGTATRERTALNTITHHDAPGAQCGPGQGLSFGTHDTVDERTETQNGSAPVEVQITVDPFGGTYSVQYAVPDPEAAERHTYKEAWNICNAPKPQNVDQTATRPAGPVETYTFSGTLNPDDPTIMDGSHTDQVTGGATTTVTWHFAQRVRAVRSLRTGSGEAIGDIDGRSADGARSAGPGRRRGNQRASGVAGARSGSGGYPGRARAARQSVQQPWRARRSNQLGYTAGRPGLRRRLRDLVPRIGHYGRSCKSRPSPRCPRQTGCRGR